MLCGLGSLDKEIILVDRGSYPRGQKRKKERKKERRAEVGMRRD
jgi:hypothetical protein